MKQKFHHFVAAALSFCLFLNITMVTSSATARASDYYAVTLVHSSAPGNGDVLIEYDVSSTDFMDELGVHAVAIWEQQANGSYSIVYTYTRYNTSGFIEKNVNTYSGSVTYHGTSGVNYYATVQFYAKDSRGNESLYDNTKIVTA